MPSHRSPLWLILPLAAGLAAGLGWLTLPWLWQPGEAQAAPLDTLTFINELHYDNTGADSGEGVEIAGPAGTDLAGWSLVLYNGGTGALYHSRALSGILPDQQNGFGVLFFAYPADGLQNGAPDGLALIDASGGVIQFLSYEGAFTALDGPASGLASTPIGISEDGDTPVGHSLQLTGGGQSAQDFSWSGPALHSYGQINPGQAFQATADLVIGLRGGSTALPGGPLSYTLAVTNTAIPGAAGTVVTVTLPLSANLTAQNSPFPLSNPAPGEYTWLLGEVLSDTQVSFQFTVTLDHALIPGTLLTATARLGSLAWQDDPATNRADWTASVAAPSLTPRLSKRAPLRVDPGSTFTYTLSIYNDFAYTLTDVILSDVLPGTVEFVHASAGGALVDGAVAWSFPSLGPYASLQASLAVTAGEAITYITNAAYAVSAGNFPTPTSGAAVVTLVSPDVRIRHLQGRAHRSPLAGRAVTGVEGIVTARRVNGFYLQDPLSDGDDATSEAIFVYLGAAPPVQVGDHLAISGTVEEHYPGGEDAGGLAVTRLAAGPGDLRFISGGAALPDPITLGAAGRLPPSQVIDDDAAGNVETGGSFDAWTDGIDFYESLEGMRVRLEDALAVGGPDAYGEIPVVGDGGTLAGLLSPQGTLVIQPGDFNPERILLDDAIFNTEPQVRAGALFAGSITGVVDYSDGIFRLVNSEPLPPASGGTVSEIASARGDDQLTAATFNLNNLDPADSSAKLTGLADQIVNSLGAPDLIAVQEVQDDSGSLSDGVVSAGQTFQVLISAIQAAGGPLYQYRQIDPLNNQDGGDPGGNIRVGFLFRPDRISFVDRPGGDAVTPVSVRLGASGTELSISPGRVDPTNPAFYNSRKPLAGEFFFQGKKVFAIATHFNSKLGDTPLFGRYQPPIQSTATQRLLQAQVVHGFASQLLALDPSARLIVLGDFNDFPFSPALDALAGAILHPLIELLPPPERYTYIFDGNAQPLDGILASSSLWAAAPSYDIVHVNAAFPAGDRPSDHDPSLAQLNLPDLLAGFSSNSPILLGEAAVFTNTSVGDAPLAFTWDFGDSTPGVTTTHPLHWYNTPGLFTVTLTAAQGADSSVFRAGFRVDAGRIHLPYLGR